jgi:hypothetical protein
MASHIERRKFLATLGGAAGTDFYEQNAPRIFRRGIRAAALDDVIVVSTADAVLVSAREGRAVKTLVEQLKAHNHRAAAAASSRPVELPVLVAIAAKPVARIVVPFICKPHSDPVVAERPHFLDQPIIEFAIPFAREKRLNHLAAVNELGPVAPTLSTV